MTDNLITESRSEIEINGELVSLYEARSLLRMLVEDARRIAGQFHNMNRSAKFRINWPDEDQFAGSEWRNFIDATHTLYADLLGKKDVSDYDKKRLLQAIVLWRMVGDMKESTATLQIMPDSQQFHGDKTENRKTAEKFGDTPNLRAWLRRSTAPLYH